jgi:hypothetical protein
MGGLPASFRTIAPVLIVFCRTGTKPLRMIVIYKDGGTTSTLQDHLPCPDSHDTVRHRSPCPPAPENQQEIVLKPKFRDNKTKISS